MRMILALTLIMSMAFSEGLIGMVDADTLRVRECNSKERCAVVGVFKDGDVVYLEKKLYRGWYKIVGEEMYIHGDYVRIIRTDSDMIVSLR